jgi:valyl-tRNA synthetase
MKKELATVYDHAAIEGSVYERWLAEKAFAAIPDHRENRYVIMMPLPNVTGALHMGHAMDNVMQDLLISWHRMMGDNTLWMPGTDHAGIATQAVIEKRLFELEGKTRHDIGRDVLVARIWEWKNQYEQRIVQQLQSIGCSCDWDKQRFTLDEVCSAAVRETFFRMFRDGLIYRGNRLVNWDCQLQTAVSDDEIYYDAVQGYFWYLRYPIIDPKLGEPKYVVVATTRPETMLGDTAVACHPNPAAALDQQIQNVKERMTRVPGKERALLEDELQQLEERKKTHLPTLEKFVEMAKDGRQVLLPLQERKIPLIADEWAKPELGSGCVKITPGHDPNDYDVWQRHQHEIGIINILNPDGSLNANAGAYAGLDRFEARKRVVADLEAQDLIESIAEHEVEIGHSDRSKTPIEPYLSQQWFVRMGDVEGGIVCGRGTPKEFHAPGLAQAAIDAARGEWKSPTGRKVVFHPDPVRYENMYYSWLAEKRDWCISRQLWWGHRIPIWSATVNYQKLTQIMDTFKAAAKDDLALFVMDTEGNRVDYDSISKMAAQDVKDIVFEVQLCPRNKEIEETYLPVCEQLGLQQDPDVLDTWFSSALWPHSTLGWPSPAEAKINKGQAPLGSVDGKPDTLSYYYPGSCLVTARDIITLWVARMVVTGLYNLGDVPFTDVFIHANILDGKGERMSKSKGNGIDPVDIVEQYGTDAMRYVLCDMQTGTQDIHLPVQAISPYTNEPVDLATAKHGRTIFTYICPKTGKEFDVLGAIPDLPAAKVISDRFDVGKHFCNKLWNAARLVLMNLEEQAFRPLSPDELFAEDRWILSRLSQVISAVTAHLQAYNPSAALSSARDFFWSEFCDWYLELIKPRLKNEAEAFVARQVLVVALDQILRLFHPFVPFITEAIWEHLGAYIPTRGIDQALPSSELLILAAWPEPDLSRQDQALEAEFAVMQDVIRSIRNVRGKYNIAPAKKLDAHIKANAEATTSLTQMKAHIVNLCNLSVLEIAPTVERPKLSAVQVIGDLEIYLVGVLDPEKERERLTNQKKKLLKELTPIQKKLENQEFLNRAPAHVIEKERQKVQEMTMELALIEENLKMLA